MRPFQILYCTVAVISHSETGVPGATASVRLGRQRQPEHDDHHHEPPER
jgi:hypothetical protein